MTAVLFVHPYERGDEWKVDSSNVVFDEKLNETTGVAYVTLGRLPSYLGDVAMVLADDALNGQPARLLLASVRRQLRKYRREGEKVLRFIRKNAPERRR